VLIANASNADPPSLFNITIVFSHLKGKLITFCMLPFSISPLMKSTSISPRDPEVISAFMFVERVIKNKMIRKRI
jgi:hypothetical protein